MALTASPRPSVVERSIFLVTTGSFFPSLPRKSFIFSSTGNSLTGFASMAGQRPVLRQCGLSFCGGSCLLLRIGGEAVSWIGRWLIGALALQRPVADEHVEGAVDLKLHFVVADQLPRDAQK